MFLDGCCAKRGLCMEVMQLFNMITITSLKKVRNSFRIDGETNRVFVCRCARIITAARDSKREDGYVSVGCIDVADWLNTCVKQPIDTRINEQHEELQLR